MRLAPSNPCCFVLIFYFITFRKLLKDSSNGNRTSLEVLTKLPGKVLKESYHPERLSISSSGMNAQRGQASNLPSRATSAGKEVNGQSSQLPSKEKTATI